MKKKHNEGFSLVEVLVAIVILGIFVVPTCSSLILSFQMNQKTAQMLKAQQAVSSAVEELKATGVKGLVSEKDGVKIDYDQISGEPFYTVTITSTELASVSVTTVIRDAYDTGEAGGGS